LDNAWRAFWLAENVDLEDAAAPPSVGRVIAALAEVDSFRWSSQEDRLKMCEKAFGAAQGVGRPELLLVTRFWRGNVLRSMARFTDARNELKWQGQEIENPWLRALNDRFLGILEQNTNNNQKALGLLESAVELYRVLDPHIGGLVLNQQGVVHFNRRDFVAAFRIYRQAVPFFDERRDSRPLPSAVPINLAVALARHGDLEQASAELCHCRYDRSAYPAIAAAEVFTRGCISLLGGKARDAAELFVEAKRRFEALGQPRDGALAATYSVEAFYALGDRNQGIEAAIAAGRFFEAAGCPRDTLEAVAKIQALLVEEAASVRDVASSARRLAERHGGWLPLLD